MISDGGKLNDVGFGCVDLRIEQSMKEIGKALDLRFFLSPGAKFGRPEDVFDAWTRQYAAPGRRVFFFPHWDCKAQSSDMKAIQQCVDYADYFFHHRVRSAVVWVADGRLELVYNGLDDEMCQRVTDLVGTFRTPFNHLASARCISVGEHFSLRWSSVLRACMPYLEHAIGHLPHVAEIFGDGTPLPIHFSAEISEDQRRRALDRLLEAGVRIAA